MELLGSEMADIIHDEVQARMAPILKRIEQLEEVQRQLEDVVTSAKAVAYRGVHKMGEAYDSGDLVTFGGSLWHCNTLTKTRPGEGAAEWTLAVKRGRDGKDAR